MLKRVIPFLVVLVTLLIASCSAAAPQDSYASAMQPAIEKLAAWEKLNTDFENLLRDTSMSSTGMSRLDIIELYNMAVGYQITRDDYVKLGFTPLDILVGDATKIAKQGHEIVDIMSAASPAEEVQTAHQTLLKCVQARVAFAEGMVDSIKNLKEIDLNTDLSSCSSHGQDLEQLTTYVNGKK